jgi:hypothetical protein
VSKVSFAQFIWSLVAHALSASGSLGHHLRTMSGVPISDTAACQRRKGLRWEWFEALFAQVLRPRAQRSRQPESFYHGHRLLGLDGSEWSLRNTEAITTQPRPRHINGQGREAAFHKWGTAVLLELGTHQPLAAARTLPGLDHAEGELNIARRVFPGIPQDEDTLLLADRLYGCGRFLCDVQRAAGPRCALLLRVRQKHKAKVMQQLSDGSALVEIRVSHPGTNRTERKVRVREVRGHVWRQPPETPPGQQAPSPEAPARSEVRLWTTLLDEKQHPAKELLALYAQRWEQELFFRELKRHVGREHLLRAGSVESAEAEYGALIIAASLLAEQRLAAAQSVALPPMRLSVGKIGKAMEALLPVLSVAGDLLSAGQREGIIARFMAHVAREAVIPPRRSRSCQRGVRKPQCSWPRIHSRSNLDGTCVYAVVTV